MKLVDNRESFSDALLAHVNLCYGIALKLTKDPLDARHLTMDVITQAWHLRDDSQSIARIKSTLLTTLRARYLEHYRHPRSTATIAPPPVLIG